MSTGEPPVSAKPTVEELGIDVEALKWQRSASGTGSIEIAFAGVRPGPGEPPGATQDSTAQDSTAQDSTAQDSAAQDGGEWVLMRVTDDPARRVLVYDRFEWECFLDGVKNGEFDDAQ